MEYRTAAGTPSQPEQTYHPSEGISTGGVLTLILVTAIAVAAKRSREPKEKVRKTDRTADSRKTDRTADPKTRPESPEKLPTVSMETLRGETSGDEGLGGEPPAKKKFSVSGLLTPREDKGEETGEEEVSGGKRMSPISASSAKVQASKLDIPYDLAFRLQNANWKAMCRSRRLSGLERGDLEKTPYGVAVHVKFGGSLDFASVQRSVDQLETGLDTETGAIRLRPGRTAGSGILDVRIRDPLAEGVPWEEPAAPVRLAHPLLLAKTPFGDRIELDLKQRIGVFGASGSGKSCVERLIGAHVAQAVDADLEIWDLKFGMESQHYEGKAHRVTSVDAAVGRVDWLLNVEFPRRAEKLKERGVSEWKETPWDAARVIIIDEGNVVIRGFGDWQPEKVEGEPAPARGGPLKDLFRAVEQGRALGVYFVWATQFPKATNLPTEIRSQLNVRICLKLESSEESAVVFKDDVRKGWTPHDLLGPGWLLVKSAAHRQPVEAKAVWLTSDRFKTVRAAVPDSGPDPDRTVLPSRTGQGQSGQSLSQDRAGQDRTVSRDRTEPTLGSPGQGTDTGQDRTDVSRDIEFLLVLSGDSLGVSELSSQLGKAKSTIHGALQRMVRDGRVVQDGAGYRLRTARDAG